MAFLGQRPTPPGAPPGACRFCAGAWLAARRPGPRRAGQYPAGAGSVGVPCPRSSDTSCLPVSVKGRAAPGRSRWRWWTVSSAGGELGPASRRGHPTARPDGRHRRPGANVDGLVLASRAAGVPGAGSAGARVRKTQKRAGQAPGWSPDTPRRRRRPPSRSQVLRPWCDHSFRTTTPSQRPPAIRETKDVSMMNRIRAPPRGTRAVGVGDRQDLIHADQDPRSLDGAGSRALALPHWQDVVKSMRCPELADLEQNGWRSSSTTRSSRWSPSTTAKPSFAADPAG